MPEAQVWYCTNRRCRRVYKFLPESLRLRGWERECCCKTPAPQMRPTLVVWDERDEMGGTQE